MSAIDLVTAVSAARAVARDVLAEQAEKIDAEAVWPEAGMRALADAGLYGLVVPERYGGSGLGLHALARVCEELGQACSSTAISYGMHCVGSAVIASQVTEEQASRYLEPIAAGRHLTTLALSEPGSGSHFYLPSTRLTSAGDGYRVNGMKAFVTNGTHADSYVISVADAEQPGTFSCVVIDADTPQVSWGDRWNGFGMRGNDSRTMTLDDAPVPRGNLLGKEGDQTWYVLNVVAPNFLTAMAGTYVGIATAALHHAIEHLRARKHDHTGTALSENPVLQRHVGRLWTKVERSRRLLEHAAREADARDPNAPLALFAAKADVAETAIEVANEVMTLVGGIGYRDGSAPQRFLRDARAAHIMSPTTDLLHAWTGRWLLGAPLFGD